MGTKIMIEVDEAKLKELVVQYLSVLIGTELTTKDVKFEVITKENYRAEAWENGRFRATVDKEGL